MAKKYYPIVSAAVTRNVVSQINGTITTGICTGILISSNKALCDLDNVTIQYLDNKGVIPIIQNWTIAELRELANILGGSAKCSITGSQIYLPIGCVTLDNAQINVSITTEANATNVTVEGVATAYASASGTLYVGMVHEAATFEHIIQYVVVTGSQNALEMEDLFILNVASVPTSNIEVAIKRERSMQGKAIEFLALSNALERVESGNNLNVARVLDSEAGLSVIDLVQTDATVKMAFTKTHFFNGQLARTIANVQTTQLQQVAQLAQINPEKAKAVVQTVGTTQKTGGKVTPARPPIKINANISAPKAAAG